MTTMLQEEVKLPREIVRGHVAAIVKEVVAGVVPPAPLRVSEWAERFAVLPSTISAEPGRWRNYPYQVAILDAFSDPRVEFVIAMKSARVGWTRLLGHVIGYHIHHDPCSILLVQPAIEDAKGESREALEPMFRDTPVLAELVAKPKRNSPDNTVFKKFYPGGILHIIGANSPRGFRRITVRVVLFDEVDAYPPSAGTEGDQISLGIRRAETFFRRKVAIGSTPTLAGASRIEEWFEKSNKGYWAVPCPHCGTPSVRRFFPDDEPPVVDGQRLGIFRAHWKEGRPETAQWVCGTCGGLIDPVDRKIDAEGQWIGEGWRWTRKEGFVFGQGFSGKIGFSIWAADAHHPRSDLRYIVSEYLQASETDEQLQVFYNTVLGRPWQPRAISASPEDMAGRAEDFEHEVPVDDVVLTAGVDVQGDRLEVEVVAWRQNEESWSVEYEVIPGDTSHKSTWDILTEYLNSTWLGPSRIHRVRAVGIDAGFRQDLVIDFCRRAPVIAYPLKGVAGQNRPIVTPPSRKTRVTRRARGHSSLEIVGVDTAKALVLQRAMITTPGPGYMHVPRGRSKSWFTQLNSEKIVITRKRGISRIEWIKTGEHNEALDCRVYALAALRLYSPRAGEFGSEERELKTTRSIDQDGRDARRVSDGVGWSGEFSTLRQHWTFG